MLGAQGEMAKKMTVIELEQCTEEAAASIFGEVLGHRAGYARGLGEMVIPKSTNKNIAREREKHYAEKVESYKKENEHYKKSCEELRTDLGVLLERMAEYDKTLGSLRETMQAQEESRRET